MSEVLRARNQMYRQRHLWGYRSRIRTPNPNPNPNPKTHPNPNPIFKLTLTNPNLFFWKKTNTTAEYRSTYCYIYRLFTKGRGRLYERPISRKGTLTHCITRFLIFLVFLFLVHHSCVIVHILIAVAIHFNHVGKISRLITALMTWVRVSHPLCIISLEQDSTLHRMWSFIDE